MLCTARLSHVSLLLCFGKHKNFIENTVTEKSNIKLCVTEVTSNLEGHSNHIEISGFIQSSRKHTPNKINPEIMVNMPEMNTISIQSNHFRMINQYLRSNVINCRSFNTIHNLCWCIPSP